MNIYISCSFLLIGSFSLALGSNNPNDKGVDSRNDHHHHDDWNHFHVPSNCHSVTDCNYTVTWEDRGTSADFEMTAKVSAERNIWFAIAFSKDRKMVDSSVVMCKRKNDGGILIQSYYTNATVVQPPQFADANNPTLGITEAKGSLEHTADHQLVFKCSFKRQKKIESMSQRFFDINDESYFILIARGATNTETDVPGYHGTNRLSSEKKYDFTNSGETLLIKRQGLLMALVLAFLAASGTLIAF